MKRLWRSVTTLVAGFILLLSTVFLTMPNWNELVERHRFFSYKKSFSADVAKKTILVDNGKPLVFNAWKIIEGSWHFIDCPVKHCSVSEAFNEASFSKADVVIFAHKFKYPSFQRPPNQIWGVLFWESPPHSPDLTKFRLEVNWTVTYRRDSTVLLPYGRFMPFDRHIKTRDLNNNYASGRDKKIVWVVSNCHGKVTNRFEYAKELSNHISVDIYGRCGNITCLLRNMVGCNAMFRNHYKFYLAFENSKCRDYITEKFFLNSLSFDLLPIVMGPPREDYEKVAPYHSFIHVEDFDSPKELAEYLKLLDKDDSLYNEYFQWKRTGVIIERVPTLPSVWCDLCAKAWEKNKTEWYEDVEDWWRGPGICIERDERWNGKLYRDL